MFGTLAQDGTGQKIKQSRQSLNICKAHKTDVIV